MPGSFSWMALSPVVYFDLWSSGSAYPHDLLNFLPWPFSDLLAYLHICCYKTFPGKIAAKLLLRWITTAEFFFLNHFIFAFVFKKLIFLNWICTFIFRNPWVWCFLFYFKEFRHHRELSCFRVVQTHSVILFLLSLIHQRGLPWCSAGREHACNAGDLGSIPGLGRSPGEGKGYPLQCSGLENSTGCISTGSQTVGQDWATFSHS